MIAVDTNILLYAHFSKFPLHRRAAARIRELAEGAAAWAIPVFCVAEFIRVSTHRRVFDPPWSSEAAGNAIKRLCASPSLSVLQPGTRFVGLLLEAVVEASATGNLVFDAQIAAICREAGISALLSEDRDFSRFEGLRVIRL